MESKNVIMSSFEDFLVAKPFFVMDYSARDRALGTTTIEIQITPNLALIDGLNFRNSFILVFILL